MTDNPLLAVRDALARCSGGQLHVVALKLAERMEANDRENRFFRDGHQGHFEQFTMELCEALSRFASEEGQ